MSKKVIDGINNASKVLGAVAVILSGIALLVSLIAYKESKEE